MDWFKANKRTLNLAKTECLLFTNKKEVRNLSINLGNHTLHTTETVKFLGVWIDNKMSWSKHISNLTVKLKQSMHLLRQSNKFLTKATKKLVYYAHVYSHLIYGILIWGNMINQCTISKIQKILNKCFNLITGLAPTLENFKKEKMLRLTDLIKLENSKLGYQLDKKLLPVNLQELLWTDSKNRSLQKTHKYNTREKHLPKLPKVTSSTYQRGFQFQSIKDYEATPVNIRNTINLNHFTSKMKLHLLSTD